MPIWSLTAERLAKLKEAIAKKKAEHDDLLARSEKDLWCMDLDDFLTEWEKQIALDAEIQTNIRRMGRRVSKKIGAGKDRKGKDDDAWEPEKKGKGKGKGKAATKVETKSSQRFAEMFSSKPTPNKEPKAESPKVEEIFSDDDFAALSRSKHVTAKPSMPRSTSMQSGSRPLTEEPEANRNQRAAASKARTLFDVGSESDDDDDQMLDDIGSLVKGIGKPQAESNGRVSLYAMNRPESSQGNGSSTALPKLKSKSSRMFEVDSHDETNYEGLARSSPHRVPANREERERMGGLSTDEETGAARYRAKASKASSSDLPAGLSQVKKARGRPAKSKPIEEAKVKAVPKTGAKASQLSPAAKAYAARKGVKKSALGSESDDEALARAEAPATAPARRVRPGRAAAARKPVVIDEDSSRLEEESDDPFQMDSD